MKKTLGVLLVLGMLTGVMGAGSALAATDTPGAASGEAAIVQDVAGPTGLQADGSNKELRQKLHGLKQQLAGKFQKLRELRQEGRKLAGELKEQRATLKVLVAEAKENGETEKLAKLEPIRSEARVVVENTKKLRAEKREMWQEFRGAVLRGDFQQVENILDKIISVKQAINGNLEILTGLLDRAIAVLR